MRSSTDLGDDWPDDMAVTVDSPHALLELLWLREAHGLEPGGADLPPLLAERPPASTSDGERAAAQRQSWQAMWPFVWDAVLEHAAGIGDPAALDRIERSAPGSAERIALLRRFIGPTWRDRVGDDAFDSAYEAWVAERFEERRSAEPQRLEDTPERRALRALVPAWRAGLLKIVTIPCRGEHTRVLGRNALLVTDGTRDDPDRYAAALAVFVQEAPFH